MNRKLYIRPTCPFCQKVLSFMKQEGIEIEIVNISESKEKEEELKAIGGKTQVPCLVENGQALYESDDIIEKLKS